MANKKIGLASSKYISNGYYSINNSVGYVPPPPPEPVNPIIPKVNEIKGVESSKSTIILIVACIGGSFLFISLGVCLYCFVKIRNRRRAEAL